MHSVAQAPTLPAKNSVSTTPTNTMFVARYDIQNDG